MLLGLFVFIGLVFSWGPDGHKIVGRVAYQIISDTTKHVMQPLLNHHNLSWLAPLVDSYDHNYPGEWNKPYHYIDVQGKTFDVSTDCPGPQYVCVYGSILNYTKRLEPSNPACDATSHPSSHHNPEPCNLEYITHFAADIHCPVHVTNDKMFPQGGNKLMVNVTFLKDRPRGEIFNIHKVWDTVLIEEHITRDYGRENWEKWADKVYDDLMADGGKLLREYGEATDPAVWAAETLTASYDNANHFDRSTKILDESYFEYNIPCIHVQLCKSAARLIPILNKKLS